MEEEEEEVGKTGSDFLGWPPPETTTAAAVAVAVAVEKRWEINRAPIRYMPHLSRFSPSPSPSLSHSSFPRLPQESRHFSSLVLPPCSFLAFQSG